MHSAAARRCGPGDSGLIGMMPRSGAGGCAGLRRKYPEARVVRAATLGCSGSPGWWQYAPAPGRPHLDPALACRSSVGEVSRGGDGSVGAPRFHLRFCVRGSINPRASSGHSITTWSASFAMNPTEAPFGPGRTLRRLIPLFVVPLLVGDVRAGGPTRFGPPRSNRDRIECDGYLPSIGGPGLRFRDPEPATERPVARVSADAPPVPATEVATLPSRLPVAAPKGAAPGLRPTPGPASRPPPAPILPDDLRPQVRPEDFLPYFQIPGGSPGSDPVGVPLPSSASPPAALPPSSASFQQTTR
jgi:hypothetical protein